MDHEKKLVKLNDATALIMTEDFITAYSELKPWIAHNKLTFISGPSGVGKTTLALKILEDLHFR